MQLWGLSMNKIRYHHLLCMNYFKGYGYSEEFTKNMYKIIDNLKKENKLKLTLKDDDICASCPNLINGVCVDQIKVLKYDQKVKDLIDIEENIELEYDKINGFVIQNILPIRENICEDCKWKDLCKNN